MKIAYKAIVYLAISLLLISIMIGCQETNPDMDDERKMIASYISERYDALSSEVFYNRVDRLQAYYSDELLKSDSWLVNEEYIDATYDTLNEYNIKTSVLEFSIDECGDNAYNIELYVLYTPENVLNQHYMAYQMIVYTSVQKKRAKIKSIEVLERIPIFTGGKEIIIDHDMFHELEHEHNEETQ